MLLIGLVGVLSRSRTVQTYLAQKTVKWLSKELGVTVRIKALEFDFFQNIHLEGVYIGDKAGDSMISVAVLDLALKKYDGENRKILIKKAAIKGALVNIGYHRGDKDKNIDFLIDYISGPPKTDNSPKKIWLLRFDDVQLAGSEFRYFDESKMVTAPGELDENNLHFFKINGTLKNLDIVDDSLHFTARNVRTIERSGLTITKMNALCNIHYKGMDFDDLSLFTSCSHIQGDLHFDYPGYKYLDEFVDNTQWKGNISESKICLKELSIFTDVLKDHPESIKVNKLKVAGTFSKLRLTRANLEFGAKSQIRGDFYMDGLPDWRTTYCEYRLANCKTTAVDLERILNGIQLPEVVHNAQLMVANGYFTGQFFDFKWQGEVATALGNVETDLLMNFKPGAANATFSGRLASTGFDLSQFNSQLGHAVFDLNLDGSGLEAKSFQMQVKADIPHFEIRGRGFDDAFLDGNLTAKLFEGKAIFNDLRLNSDFTGKIDFEGVLPKFDFKANARGIDLFELGLDTLHTLVWVNARIQSEGINPNDIQGYGQFSNIYISRGDKTYEYNNQNISKIGATHTIISLDGDWVNGFLQGNVSVNNIGDIVNNSFADLFPKRIKKTDYKGADSFLYEFQILDPSLLYDLFYPGLGSSKVSIYGNFNINDGTASVQLPATDFYYNNVKIEALEIHADRKNDVLNYSAAAHNFYSDEEVVLKNIGLKGAAQNGKATYNLKLSDNTGSNTIDVDAISEILESTITLNVGESLLNVNNEAWTIGEESQIRILDDGAIQCDYLYLDGVTHYVEARGKISSSPKDTLLVDFGNFGLDFVRPFIKESLLDSFEGRFNGNIKVSALLGWPRFEGEISGRDLEFYSVSYGDVDVELKDLNQTGRLSLNAAFSKGIADKSVVSGSIGYKKQKNINQLALLVDLPKTTSISALQPFLQDVLTFHNGNMGGQVNITGDIEKPKLDGFVDVNDINAEVDYLKTGFLFSGSFFINQYGIFTKKPFTVYDEVHVGSGKMTMAITHKNFNDFKFDLNLDSVVNMRCLNTHEGDDDIYYGTAFVDGNCHIYGPFEQLNMDINLKSRKNSDVKILYSDVEENDRLGYVVFEKRGRSKSVKDSVKSVESDVINRINITLQVNPDLEAEFVIDKRLGDVIRGTGNGLIKMTYNEHDEFLMYGSFVAVEGDYVFSIPGINLLTKKVALNQGGTILWSGDPYNAVLNMTGSFEKRISPAALMTAVTTTAGVNYPPIKVQSILFMTGNLLSPQISFDIKTPELENSAGGTANDVYRVIQRIRSDKDETMRQAVALLLFGNFITPSFAQGSATALNPVSGTGVAGNSLSNIASGVVNDIFARMGLPTRIQVNIDDVRSAAGSNTKVFVNSEWFLTDRVRLDVNYDPTVGVLVNSVAVPINFNLEYMTRNENWRFKAFSRSSNLLLQQSSTAGSGTSVSGNTLGVGVVYRREFNTFRPKYSKDSTRVQDTVQRN